MKRKYMAAVLCGTAFLCLPGLTGCGEKEPTAAEISPEHSTEESTLPENMAEYMVLLGENPENLENFPPCETLVIDGEYYTKEDVERLRENGAERIYSYLNIGSIEEFREYYDDYADICLGNYENWPDEHWVDVTSGKWQQAVSDRAEELEEKGFDGYFIDNMDVYDRYPKAEIYEALIDILKELHDRDMTVVINGGDTFVQAYLAESNGTERIFDGVNQESVYTAYDFDAGECGENTEEDREYYTEYLCKLIDAGYTVCTLEYADREGLAEAAYEYAKEYGFTCYVSENIDLTLDP